MFKVKKYQVIKNAVSYELANFLYNYFMLKRDAVKFMYENNIHYLFNRERETTHGADRADSVRS